tara:strand:+ start:124 stop:417 length:294 start_codon:yes stop_codon:yes gene_type:complete
MNKFQKWAANRKPKPKVKKQQEITLEVELTPEEELAIAWEECKIAFKWPIRFLVTFIAACAVILVLHSWAVSDILNDCYLDKRCKQWVSSGKNSGRM